MSTWGRGICAVFLVLLVLILLPAPLTAGGRETSSASDSSSDAEVAHRVTVCILDSGCNVEGARGWNYLDNSDDLSEDNEHGTLVYQIVSEGAPDADIYMLKCVEDAENVDGGASSASADETEEAIIQALYDAVDVYHADIINISWTGNRESEALHEAVCYAADKGVIIVAAAGNLSFATPLGSEVYPAAWDETIGVAGVDLDENGEPESSLWYLHGDAVFVCADGNYQEQRGSSFAAPRVTAVLAQHLAGITTVETFDLEQAQTWLKSIAKDAGEPGYDTTFGWGFIDCPRV